MGLASRIAQDAFRVRPRFGLVIWLPYVTIPHAVAWVPFHWFSTRHSSGERRSGSWRIPAWKARSDCRTQHDIRVTWASWWWILISSNETSTLYHTIFKVIYIYTYISSCIQSYPYYYIHWFPLNHYFVGCVPFLWVVSHHLCCQKTPGLQWLYQRVWPCEFLDVWILRSGPYAVTIGMDEHFMIYISSIYI